MANSLVNFQLSENEHSQTQTIQQLDKPEVYKSFVEFLALPKSDRAKKYGFDTELAFIDTNGLSSATVWKWKQREHFLRDLQLAMRGHIASNGKIIEMLSDPKSDRQLQIATEFAFPKDSAPVVNITNIEQFTHNDLDLFISDIADMISDDSDDD